ncbi:MAG TPA: hypothetical protein VJ938_12950 [Acidimicrobiia bacterium]|nr:hypothetical protein [Acidimicrobiia bacterium]
MSRARVGLSIGVIVALAVAIWAAIAAGGDDPPSTTTSAPPVTTTTTVAPTTSATTPSTTSAPATSTPDTTTDAEARLEEVRLIIRDVWFGWFHALHRNDEEAVLEVIATPERLENFHSTAASVEYESEPTPAGVVVSEVEILQDSEDCLVVYSTMDVSQFQGEGSTTSGVDVLWPHDGEWRRATRWNSPSDLWEADCTADRSNELP